MRSLLMATALCAVVVMLTGCSFTVNTPCTKISHQSRLNGCGCGAGDSCNSCETAARPGLMSRFGGKANCATGDCGAPAPTMSASSCGCGGADCGPTCGDGSTDCGCKGSADCGSSTGGLFGFLKSNSIGGSMGMRLGETGSECTDGCGRSGCGLRGKLCLTCGTKAKLGGRIKAMGSKCQTAGGCDAPGGCGEADGCGGLKGNGLLSGRVRAMGSQCQAAGGCDTPGGCGEADNCGGLKGSGLFSKGMLSGGLQNSGLLNGRIRAMGSQCQAAGGCNAPGGCGEADGCRGLQGNGLLSNGLQGNGLLSNGLQNNGLMNNGLLNGRIRAMGSHCQAAGGCNAPGGCGGIGGCRGLHGGGLLGGKHTKPYGGAIPHVAENPMMGGGQVPQYVYPYYTTRGPRDFLNTNPPSIGY